MLSCGAQVVANRIETTFNTSIVACDGFIYQKKSHPINTILRLIHDRRVRETEEFDGVLG